MSTANPAASGATPGAGVEPPKKSDNQGEGEKKKGPQAPRRGKDGRCLECKNWAHSGPCWKACRRCRIRHNWHKPCPSGTVQSTSMALQPFGAMSGGGGPPPEALAHMAGFMVAAMRSWGTPVASLANLKGAAQGVTTASSKKRPPPDDAPENSSEGQGKKKRNRWQKKKKAEKEPAADGSGQQQGGQPTDPASTMEVDAPASSNAQPDDPPEPVERPLGPENKGSENAG